MAWSSGQWVFLWFEACPGMLTIQRSLPQWTRPPIPPYLEESPSSGMLKMWKAIAKSEIAAHRYSRMDPRSTSLVRAPKRLSTW